MIPERGAHALLHIQLLWEDLQGSERRETELTYVNSPGFQDLCELLDIVDLPAKIRETAKKRPAELLALLRRLSK